MQSLFASFCGNPPLWNMSPLHIRPNHAKCSLYWKQLLIGQEAGDWSRQLASHRTVRTGLVHGSSPVYAATDLR